MIHYTGFQLKYEAQELISKDKVLKGVAKSSRGKHKAKQSVLQRVWVIKPRSRQLAPRQAGGVDNSIQHTRITTPGRQLILDQSLMATRTLCRQNQADRTIPRDV